MQVFMKRWSWIAAAAGLAVSASVANAAVLIYQMDQEPSSVSYGANAMTKIGDGFGSVAAGDYGSPAFAGLQTGTNGTPGTLTYGQPGTARFVDTSNASGTHGYTRQGFTGGWTVDMRIKIEQTSGGTGNTKAFSFKQAAGNGRGIYLITSNNAGLGDFGNGFGLQVRSSGSLGSVNVPRTVGGADDEFFHSVRFVFPNDNTFKLYDLENDLDPGAGVNYNLLYTYTGGMGGTGPAASLTTAGGLALNSQSNSETNAGRHSMDWLAINDAAALGATDPAMVPEPATLGMLVLGCIPMVMRRRRAA